MENTYYSVKNIEIYFMNIKIGFQNKTSYKVKKNVEMKIILEDMVESAYIWELFL